MTVYRSHPGKPAAQNLETLGPKRSCIIKEEDKYADFLICYKQRIKRFHLKQYIN